MSNDPFEYFRKQQEQIRRLMQSPALEAIRRQQEQMQKLTRSPVLEAMQRQQEQVRKLLESPTLEAARRQQEQLQKLSESPVLEAMQRQQEQVRKLTEAPDFKRMEHQQRQFAQFLAGQPLQPLVDFRQNLAAQAVEYAAEVADEDAATFAASDADGSTGFFQFRSLQFLLWQLEGLLKALELSTAAGFATNQIAEEAVVSPNLLAILIMVVLVGELIIWFAGRPTSDEG